MNRKIKELKRIARGNLSGNYFLFINAFVTCNVITSLVEMPFSMMTDVSVFSTSNVIYYIAMALISIASVVLTAGQYRMHLSLCRTGKVNRADLFHPARYHADRYIFTEVILFGLSLAAMLPMVGGVLLVYTRQSVTDSIAAILLAIVSLVLSMYLSMTYDLVYFVLNDQEDLRMAEALKYTRTLITGHRRRYLYLQLSFLPALLLVLLSFGIGIFWVQPYMAQTTALFYLDVKKELQVTYEV